MALYGFEVLDMRGGDCPGEQIGDGRPLSADTSTNIHGVRLGKSDWRCSYNYILAIYGLYINPQRGPMPTKSLA